MQKPGKALYYFYNSLSPKHQPGKHFSSLVTLTHLTNFIFSVELSLYFAKSWSFSFPDIGLKMKITRQLNYSVE